MTYTRADCSKRVSHLHPLLVGVIALAGCASSIPQATTGADSSLAGQRLEVVFKQGRAYARQGKRQWLIAEVDQNELLWSPEATRFAYIKAQSRQRQGRTVHHLVIRSLRGDSVNEFAVYRPGRPSQLEWLDEGHISYLAPAGEGGDVYVIHEVETAEIVRIHRGSRFTWSPGRRHLAYVHGKSQHTIEIDGKVIWPNGRRRQGRRVIGNLVWSPDGRSLSFLELTDGRPQLVVLLELGDPDGHLTWALPSAAASPENKIFWGDSRIVIGQSVLQPRYAASWDRIR